MKKAVVSVDLHDDKSKQKAMQSVSGISGVESVSVDMKEKKMTVIGDIDPVDIVSKLRKLCHTRIVSVGPAKEPEKKKEEPKKCTEQQLAHHMAAPYPRYYVQTCEENPNSCVIC